MLMGGLVSGGASACPRTLCDWAEGLGGGIRDVMGSLSRGTFPRISADSLVRQNTFLFILFSLSYLHLAKTGGIFSGTVNNLLYMQGRISGLFWSL